MDEHAFNQILWKAEGFESLERCTLRADDTGWALSGTVVGLIVAPLEVRYQILVSPIWETRSVIVVLEDGAGVTKLMLDRDQHGNWRVNGNACPDIDGCFDVDLGITPATNTLPIRRLDLAIGEQASVEAAWVRFPEMVVSRLPQTYTRIDESTYRYQSATGFEAFLTVNSAGLTTDYEGGWKEVPFG